jgi:hypothetical protein
LAALAQVPTTCVHDLASRLACQKCRKAGKRPATTNAPINEGTLNVVFPTPIDIIKPILELIEQPARAIGTNGVNRPSLVPAPQLLRLRDPQAPE